MNLKLDLQEGFYLDTWLVEPQLGQVSKNGKTITIEPKIMEVLVLLAENQLKVVRRETFLNVVWGDVNVINHVLARAISELRRVFQDNPQNPRFIQTIPKIGYRLLMPVSLEIFEEKKETAPDLKTGFPLRQPISQTSSASLLFFFGGLLTAFVFLAMMVVFVFSRHQSAHFQ